MEYPKISIVVAVYNVEKYLNQCVQSLVNQTYRNLEIILIDDGATDESGKMCDEWSRTDSRIKVIHQENGGLSAARNAGLDVATGDYIGFIDSDDYIHLKMYERMYETLQKNAAELVICREQIFYDDEDVKEQPVLTDDGIIETRLQLLSHFLDDFQGPMTWTVNKLYARSLVGETRFILGKKLEDIVFSTDIMMKAKGAVRIDDRFYYYRQRRGSIMQTKVPALWKDYSDALVYQYNQLKQVAELNQEQNTLQILKRLSGLEAEAYWARECDTQKKIRKDFLDIYKRDISVVKNIKQRINIGVRRYFPIFYYMLKRKR